jgi:RluA family pseudouridine synthase
MLVFGNRMELTDRSICRDSKQAGVSLAGRVLTGALNNPPPVPIIACGSGWLVAEKPAGMSVHNDPDHDLCALLNAHLQLDKGLARELCFDPAFGLHAVHRLDKETSGVILLACRREAFQDFSLQFSQGEVAKHYLALVHGTICQTGDSGLWQWPLTPKAGGRATPQGRGKHSPSRTRYRVRQISRHYTLLDCHPLTGRTHQIRRHAALAGHPVVGDQRYGSPRACRYVAQHHNFSRLALHAYSLSLTPPGSSGCVDFQSAGIPDEITALIESDGD